jgi:hypothetical protein
VTRERCCFSSATRPGQELCLSLFPRLLLPRPNLIFDLINWLWMRAESPTSRGFKVALGAFGCAHAFDSSTCKVTGRVALSGPFAHTHSHQLRHSKSQHRRELRYFLHKYFLGSLQDFNIHIFQFPPRRGAFVKFTPRTIQLFPFFQIQLPAHLYHTFQVTS